MPPASAVNGISNTMSNGSVDPAHAADSPIKSFFAGRSVFITGATGFVGKVLVEKLLRCCPDIKTIYILCRVKKGQEPQERVRNLLAKDFFNRAKMEVPGCDRKVKPVAGDIAEENLGISPQLRQELVDNVSVILHVAATIRFTEKIKLATKMNIQSVQSILALGRDLKECAAIVHTSTAYAHTYQSECPETFLEPSHDPIKLQQLLDVCTDEVADAATTALCKRHPNTYTFTKNCAEEIIRQGHVEGLPVCIVRPSIVTPTWKEPYVGWTDTFAGPPGLMTAAGTGMARVVPGKKNNKIDMVPVDICANFLLVAAWHTYMRCGGSVDTEKYHLPAPILNATSGGENPSTCGKWVDSINKAWIKYPMMKSIARRPSLQIVQLEGSSRKDFFGWRVWIYKYWEFASELVPGYLLDLAAVAQGKQAFSADVYKRIGRTLTDYEYFLNNEWEWPVNNVKLVENSMSEADRKTFNLSMRKLHWDTYIEQMVLGIKQFKLDESVDSKTVEDARKHLRNIAFRGLLARIATGIFFVQAAQSFGLIRKGRSGTQTLWVAIFIMAWYSRRFRSWMSEL